MFEKKIKNNNFYLFTFFKKKNKLKKFFKRRKLPDVHDCHFCDREQIIATSQQIIATFLVSAICFQLVHPSTRILLSWWHIPEQKQSK